MTKGKVAKTVPTLVVVSDHPTKSGYAIKKFQHNGYIGGLGADFFETAIKDEDVMRFPTQKAAEKAIDGCSGLTRRKQADD